MHLSVATSVETTWPIIAGKAYRLPDADFLDISSPINDSLLARVAMTPTSLVDVAVSAVSAYWQRRRQALRNDGPATARRIASLLRERVDEGADLITREVGKLRHSDCLPEILKGADFFDWAADRMDAEGAVRVDKDGKLLAVVARQAAGVVGIITPWNFPVSIPSEYLAAAVASGSGIVWKPSEQAPRTAEWLLHIMIDAGLPAESIALVTGSGWPTGDAVFASAPVDVLCFTGSTQAGASLSRHVGLRRRIFELGGNCPVVISDVEDIAATAAELLWGAISNAGQRCNSVERVIVTSEGEAALLANEIGTLLDSIRVGDPWQETSQLGPVATKESAARIRRHLQEAQRDGATVRSAAIPEGLGERYLAPTLVTGVHPSMQIFQQEVFGPVLTITAVDGLDAAISAANSTDYGLYGAAFSSNEVVVDRCAEELNVSVVLRNRAPGRWDAILPVGGASRSGSGVGRVGAAYALDEISETHCVQW